MEFFLESSFDDLVDEDVALSALELASLLEDESEDSSCCDESEERFWGSVRSLWEREFESNGDGREGEL